MIFSVTEAQKTFSCNFSLQVFAGYIPGILPAMREHELSGYIDEIRELQTTLRQFWITSNTQGRKRCLDEEMPT